MGSREDDEDAEQFIEEVKRPPSREESEALSAALNSPDGPRRKLSDG
jgi:hypothetical protein